MIKFTGIISLIISLFFLLRLWRKVNSLSQQLKLANSHKKREIHKNEEFQKQLNITKSELVTLKNEASICNKQNIHEIKVKDFLL